MGIVTHSGTVSEITPKEVSVTIRSSSACLHCQLQKSCTMADCRLKTVRVTTDKADSYHLGQAVTVSMDSRLAWIAVFWGYIFPLILVLGTLMISLQLSAGETTAAIASLAVLPPYYLLLALFKKYFFKYNSFKISAE